MRVLLSPRVPVAHKMAVFLYERLWRIFPGLGNCFWPGFKQRYCELVNDAKVTLAMQGLEQGADQVALWQTIHCLRLLALACPHPLDQALTLALTGDRK